MENNKYKSNSNVSKEKPQIEKITKGKVIRRKQNLLKKLSSEIISEDVKNIKSYVISDVLIPAIKKAISDIITNGIDMALYGGTRSKNRDFYDRISYRSYSAYSEPNKSLRSLERRPTGYSFDDIILSSRGEAEEVLLRMDELIDKYGLVRVADLYDLVGITGQYTDNKYGWTNIRMAEIRRVRDGYIIDMPRAITID